MAGRKKNPNRKLPPAAKSVVPLYPYQQRWVDDESRWKLAVKARQVGFTFAATLRAVLKRLREPGLTVWLSASERQALEAMEQMRRHLHALGVDARFQEAFLEGSSLQQHRVALPNGSRLIALPANPDTVRGFAGDIILDEFAFHRDSHAIWRAAFATATRGFQLEVISTPNGAQGKFYELARQAGLVDMLSGTAKREPGTGLAADSRFTVHESRSVWSGHWCDVYTARALGFDVDLNSLRAAVDDDDTWQQEYCCRFLSDAAPYLPLELVVAAETSPHADPAAATPLHFGNRASSTENRTPYASFPDARSPLPEARCYLGVDIGRHRDRTVLWLLEERDGILWTRLLHRLEAAPFATQQAAIASLLALRADSARALFPVLSGAGFSERSGDPPLSGGSPHVSAAQNGGAFRSESRSCGTSGDPARFLREAPEVLLGGTGLPRLPRAQSRGAEPRGVSPVSGSFLVARCALDSTGLGAMLAEELHARFGARVEPVVFTLAVKEDLAVRLKRCLEERRLRIPYDPQTRRALGAVKRYTTSTGHFRFDAARTEEGHADEFWALALACYAADSLPISTEFISRGTLNVFSQAHIF